MAVARPPISEESWQDHNKDAADRADQQARADLAAAQAAQEQQDAARTADRQRQAQEAFAAAVAPHTQAQRTTTLASTARDLFAQATAPLRRATQARAPSAPAMPVQPGGAGLPSGGPSPDEASALERVYADARAAGLDEEGARVAQAVALTERGYGGAVGDQGVSAGTFQLHHAGGMGDSYARSLGVSPQESIARLRQDPHAANAWALSGYLGAAIREGQAKGLSGPELATYAQRYGQRSVSPERAGANYRAVAGLEAPASPEEAERPPSTRQPLAPGARGYGAVRPQALGQFEQGLPYDEAASICGPVAALAFAQANGRNPDLGEARRLARQVGWTSRGGMNGVQNEQALLERMGVASRLDTSPDFGEIAADAASGNPVIVSTGRHYYYVNGYDPATGRLRVGKTGEARRGGSAWMSAQQIADLDGGINGVLYVDSPRSPTPSVAVAATEGERPPSEFEPPTRYNAQNGAYAGGMTDSTTPAPIDETAASGGPQMQANARAPDSLVQGPYPGALPTAPTPPTAPAVGGSVEPYGPLDVLGRGVSLGMEALGKVAAPFRAGFPTPGAPSGESPGQKIARFAQQSMAEHPDWNLFRHLGEALDRSQAGFERTLELGPRYDPLTGGVVAGAAGAVSRLGTDPLTTVGGEIPGAMRAGMVGGGVAGAGYGLATGATPEETARYVETGSALGSLAAPAALGVGRLAASPGARAAARRFLAEEAGELRLGGEGAGAHPVTAEVTALQPSATRPGWFGPPEGAPRANLIRRVIDTARTAADDTDDLGRAAYLEGGVLKATHVTDDPAGVLEALAGKRALTDTRTTGDLGPGLYASDAPSVWMSRSQGKWDFAERLSAEERGRLADALQADVERKSATRYLTADEAEAALRDVAAFRRGDNDALRYLAGQPFNVPAADPSFLEQVGLRAGTQPQQVAVELRGRFADLNYNPTPSEVEALRAAGFDGAFTRSSMGTTPQTVIWNNDAIHRFGDYVRAPAADAPGIVAPDVLGAIRSGLRAPPAANVAGALAGGAAGYETTPEGATPLETALHVGAGALLGSAGVNVVRGAARGGLPGAVRGLGLETGIGQRLGIAAGEGEEVAGRQLERLRLDKFPEAVRGTIQRAAERGDFWTAQRRNVISDAEAERMADELGRTVEQMVSGGRAGRAYNTEETRALRNALTGQAIRVDDLRATLEELGEQAPATLRRTLGEEEARLLGLSRVVEGARAEAGRAFRAYLADTRGRLARSRVPAYTNVSRVPIRAAPELEGRVVQPGFEGPPEHRLGMGEPGPAAPELGPGVRQAEAFDPLEYYRGPQAPGPVAAPGPPSRAPVLTEQAPLITEPVATTGRATNLLGQTTTVGAGRVSAYDRASLVRIAGMVSSVPGQLLNLSGNLVMGGLTLGMKPLQVGADVARVGVGRALGKDVQRERYLAELLPQAEGYARGLWAGAQQVPAILRGNLPQDFVRAHEVRRLASGSAALDTAVEAPLRGLAASDAVFRSASFGGHSAALAVRKAAQEGLSGAQRTRRAQDILGNLSDHPDIVRNANQLAARDVFQEARLETEAIARLKRQNTAARVAGDIVLPFYKTPYNVAAQGAGMTPAGYLGALAAARRGETGEAVDRAVRATVGTMALGLGLHLASTNLLTGAYPATEAERSTLPEGWKPYSLRVPAGDGAVYVPIQAFGAAAVPLGVAAIVTDAQKRGARKEDLRTALYAGLGGIGQFMGDMSALQGLNSVMKLATEPERSVERTAESFGASLVPYSGLARQVQQALGDAQRDPDNPVQAFMAGIPGLSQFVPEKLTSLGEARSRGPSGWRALVTGGRIGVERDEPTLAAYREAGVSLAPPGESVLGHALTPEEQRRVQIRSGELLRERVGAWQTDPEFRALGADERKDILDRARTRAREDAAVEVLDPLSADELARRREQYRLKRPA